MKRIIVSILFLVGLSFTSNAQIDFGLKGGLNYNSNSIKEVGTDIIDGAKSKTGYHAGIWLRFKIPAIGFYLRPELVYTSLANEVFYKDAGKNTAYNFRKIDIPVLLGKKIFGIGNVYIGPSFQYILGSDFSISDITNVESDGFTLGMQFGGGIEFGKLGVDVRWERAFTGVESALVSNLGVENFDIRVNQIIVGLYYKL